MSVMRLIRTNGPLIPGGFQFSDPITGKQYSDHHTLFSQRVSQIINDRRANARLFTDQKEIDPGYVSQILSEQNCTRLKGNRLFCSDGTIPQPAPVNFIPQPAPAGKRCRYCGSENLEEVLCSSCSGRRVTGYRCKACHRENPK